MVDSVSVSVNVSQCNLRFLATSHAFKEPYYNTIMVNQLSPIEEARNFIRSPESNTMTFNELFERARRYMDRIVEERERKERDLLICFEKLESEAREKKRKATLEYNIIKKRYKQKKNVSNCVNKS